jgi:HAD superfamily hydrolase (TIGR01549 family)
MVKNIIFDFDGVILDSMPIRDYGFREIFKDFDSKLVDSLIEYHNQNGGLSRFHKIKYFYNNLLNKEIAEEKILELSSEFSKIMKNKLADKNLLISETVEFIKNNYKKYNLHIASGSEDKELNYLCKELEIRDFFISINGSPTKKSKIIEKILKENNYEKNKTILIGDSINDYEASKANGIEFYGFNNKSLESIPNTFYIDEFRSFF